MTLKNLIKKNTSDIKTKQLNNPFCSAMISDLPHKQINFQINIYLDLNRNLINL